MKRWSTRISLVVLIAMLAITPTLAMPPQTGGPPDDRGGKPGWRDDLPHPLGQQQRALRQRGIAAKLRGKALGKVGEVARGQYVELAREGEDMVWAVLAEFPDLPHNSIPEPDRSVNNSLLWRPDFNRQYYLDVLFADAPGANSMRNFYIEQSSGRYAVRGDVTDWVQVPGNAASYGDESNAFTIWQFLQDAVTAWYQAQIAAGQTPADIDAYLSQFDVWDRYDADGDSNFDEPDGYIDRFQAVHAGEGEEAGGGVLGTDAIWSHYFYARLDLIGLAGPSPDYLLGGIQIGDSSYWIGDYTMQPENGGVGVFAHEFGHDLGLPDLYGGSPDNSTGFWTLMSSGSWLSDSPDDVGSKPNHMGIWEKLQLDWLNYEVAYAGQRSDHRLGPAETNTRQAQGLFVLLPDKEVNTQIADPYEGSYFYYSGAGDEIDHWMYKAFNLAPGSSLTAQVQFDIELDWDYAYLVISTDGGASWQTVETNLSTTTDPHDQNFGFGITGSSGGWVPLAADLSAYSGDVLLGFRYWTDLYVVEPGFMIDQIEVTGYPVDGAESDAGWTLDGFRVTTGNETSFHFNAYVAEFRQYRGYDDTLRIGPFNFGFYDSPLEYWVERFPYQDGLLISYWDSSQLDNDTSVHPGAGLILPIDAHPATMYRANGMPWYGRVASYDSTFGLEPTEPLTLHWFGVESTHPSQPAVPVFDDSLQYWNPETPHLGVINPHTNTRIWIQSLGAQGSFMQVNVGPSQ